MTEPDALEPKPQTQPLICYVLQFFAVIVGAVSVIAALIGAGQLAASETPVTVIDIATVALLLALGLALSAALFGLIAVLRWLHRTLEIIRALPQHATTSPAPASPPAPSQQPGISPAQLEALQRVLTEIRDYVLMTDDERRDRRERLRQLERQQRFAQVHQALQAGLYHRARIMAREIAERTGDDEDVKALLTRVDQAAQQAEKEDVVAATRQVEDLMSLTSWDQALQIAHDLVERHPDSEPAKNLLVRVQREQQTHQQEHLRRLTTEIERCTSQRQWRRALVVARELIQAYPRSAEADALRAQRETLETNAQIEHRKELEARYSEFFEAKRYADALALARQVIQEYPDSPQAKAMRIHIPQLEKHIQVEAKAR